MTRYPERRDAISSEHADWNKLRKSARWLKLRAAKLRAEPICERCKADGKVVKATVAHHRKPHKGDPALFFVPLDGLESLCKQHHDSDAQSEEVVGYSKEIGDDGLPVDPNHPFNRPS